jgi:dipeptidyl-peptidase-4
MALNYFGFLVVLLLSTEVFAENSKSNYDYAASTYYSTFAPGCGDVATPTWIGHEGDCWFRTFDSDWSWHYKVFGANSGKVSDAFDHSFVSKALSDKFNIKCDSGHIPVDAISECDGHTVSFLAEGRSFCIDKLASEIHEITPSSILEPAAAACGSRERLPLSEDRTLITFRNTAASDLTIFQVDASGSERLWGRLQAGECSSRPQFVGSVYHVTDATGCDRGTFQAIPAGSVVLLSDSNGSEGKAGKARPSTQPTTSQFTGNFTLSPNCKYAASIAQGRLQLTDAVTHLTYTDFPFKDTGVIYGNIVWSADSRRFAVLEYNRPAQPQNLYLLQSCPGGVSLPVIRSVEYYRAGQDIPSSRILVFNPQDRAAKAIEINLKQPLLYLRLIGWNDYDRSFYADYCTRGFTEAGILAIPENAQPRVVISDPAGRFIDYQKVHCSIEQQSGNLLWMSERTGWNHIYRVEPLHGGCIPVTQGDWLVCNWDDEEDKVDEKQKVIYFRSRGFDPKQDPYFVHYMRIGFDGTGLVDLTPANGTHKLIYSPNGVYYVDVYSRVDFAPVSELRRSRDGSLVCTLECATLKELRSLGWTPPEPFVAPGRDGVTKIWGTIFRPLHFDPKKSYPVLEDIYANPAYFSTPTSFCHCFDQNIVSNLGFIVVRIDGMGTNGRSRKFLDVCWHNLADAGFPDRIAWIRAAADHYKYMDISRVGIYGWSAGGAEVLSALENHSDFYRAGFADSGCYECRLGNLGWMEQWMGWPCGKWYDEQSGSSAGSKITGKLTLVVDEMDAAVDPSSTMRVVDALERADQEFDLIVNPGADHGGNWLYVARRRASFFTKVFLRDCK